MISIRKCRLPDHALLNAYREKQGCYTDCYTVEVPSEVNLRRYVSAFYCTPLFKLERLILKVAVNRPSTDRQAQQVANGEIDRFAAWSVEKRTGEQLLMCDMAARTRSWFMVEPVNASCGYATRLYFGSAVVPIKSVGGGKASLGFVFLALLGFHKLYSRALLWSVKMQL